MIPPGGLSVPPVPSPFLFPDNLTPEALLDREIGGVGLNDPSQGLMYQVWTITAGADVSDPTLWHVYLSAPNWPSTLLFSRPNISYVSLAFDQNMQPFVCFVESGSARFWWYDSTIPGFTFTTLPVGSRTPRATLDDKRDFFVPTSDIVLGYMRGSNLYYRLQSDRYLVEYDLGPQSNQYLVGIGMNEGNRLQFGIGLLEI